MYMCSVLLEKYASAQHCKAGKWARDKMTPILHNVSVMLGTKLQLSTQENKIILHLIVLHLSSVSPQILASAQGIIRCGSVSNILKA